MVQSQGALLTISRLAQAGDVGVETIRCYQRRGLLGTPDKRANGAGTRHYGAEDLRRLRFIRTAQAAGFTLEQIGELMQLDASQDRVRARTLAKERVAALNEKISELVAARDALQHLAQECAASNYGPCPIITAFERN